MNNELLISINETKLEGLVGIYLRERSGRFKNACDYYKMLFLDSKDKEKALNILKNGVFIFSSRFNFQKSSDLYCEMKKEKFVELQIGEGGMVAFYCEDSNSLYIEKEFFLGFLREFYIDFKDILYS